MPKLHETIEVDASPEEVWRVLGDLSAAPEWVPGTVSAEVEGASRRCRTADGFEIQEEISDYSDERRTYSYRHVRSPLPVRDSRGTFAVESKGRDSVVVLDAEFEVVDPAMEAEVTQMFGAGYRQALESLRRRVEAGAPA